MPVLSRRAGSSGSGGEWIALACRQPGDEFDRSSEVSLVFVAAVGQAAIIMEDPLLKACKWWAINARTVQSK
jgi:hypothetical protein